MRVRNILSGTVQVLAFLFLWQKELIRRKQLYWSRQSKWRRSKAGRSYRKEYYWKNRAMILEANKQSRKRCGSKWKRQSYKKRTVKCVECGIEYFSQVGIKRRDNYLCHECNPVASEDFLFDYFEFENEPDERLDCLRLDQLDKILTERELAVVTGRIFGEHLQVIGDRWNISGERVRQIFKQSIRRLRYREHLKTLGISDFCELVTD